MTTVLHKQDQRGLFRLTLRGSLQKEFQKSFTLPEATDVFLFLKDGDVIIAQPSQEGGAADAGRAAANESDPCVEALWHFVCWRKLWIPDLRDAHLTEHLKRANFTFILAA